MATSATFGVGELRSIAPEAFDAFDVVLATTDRGDPTLVARARSSVAAALGIGGSSQAALDDVDRFASQFVVDVGSMSEAQRTGATRALGTASFEFAQLCYVFDFSARMRCAFEQLFGVDPITTAAASAAQPADSLWPALEKMFATVARLRSLDPLTTELVRLRGARAHNCRLCKSLRSVRAAREGADETMYDQVDHFASSRLSERHKTALRLTDAMLWQPGAYPVGLREQVHAMLMAGEIVEILFDVARNAANKIAVALGADAAHVSDGIEFFDTDEQGELVYGLALDAE